MSRLLPSWPPHLADDEVIKYEGQFVRSVWLRQNVIPVIGVIALFAATMTFAGYMNPRALLYLVFLSGFGILLAALIHRNQTWIITNKAVYVRHRSPIPLLAIKKVRGFGATVRLVQAWGFSTQLLGVTEAVRVRKSLASGELL